MEQMFVDTFYFFIFFAKPTIRIAHDLNFLNLNHRNVTQKLLFTNFMCGAGKTFKKNFCLRVEKFWIFDFVEYGYRTVEDCG